MKTKQEFCHSCGVQREQAVIGLMPVMFTEGQAKAHWKKSLVCSECGDINYDAVTNQEVEQAHRRYLLTLLELGLETEESIVRKTGVQL